MLTYGANINQNIEYGSHLRNIKQDNEGPNAVRSLSLFIT